jgi:hypothetical protein
MKRESLVRAMLHAGGVEPVDRLSFFVADLESDTGLEVTSVSTGALVT